MGNNARSVNLLANDAEDPIYAKGNWYVMHDGLLAAGATFAAANLRLLPFRLRQLVNIQQLGARITTLAAGGLIQIGVYAANQLTLLPTGPVLARSASQATDAAGLVAAPVLDAAGNALGAKQLPRGLYWFGIMADATAGGTVIMQALNLAGSFPSTLIGAQSQAIASSGAAVSSYIRALAGVTFGTWPELTTAATTESASNGCAAGMFQVAA